MQSDINDNAGREGNKEPQSSRRIFKMIVLLVIVVASMIISIENSFSQRREGLIQSNSEVLTYNQNQLLQQKEMLDGILLQNEYLIGFTKLYLVFLAGVLIAMFSESFRRINVNSSLRYFLRNHRQFVFREFRLLRYAQYYRALTSFFTGLGLR
jgi:hypothetical protein